MTMVLTPGQQHETTVFEAVMEGGAVKRQGAGRPKQRPKRVACDKGYSSGKIRRYLRRRGIGITIPRKSNERHKGKFDKEVYRTRNLVERLINASSSFDG